MSIVGLVLVKSTVDILFDVTLRMVTFVASIAITCFDVKGITQRVITGIVWSFIIMLVVWTANSHWEPINPDGFPLLRRLDVKRIKRNLDEFTVRRRRRPMMPLNTGHLNNVPTTAAP